MKIDAPRVETVRRVGRQVASGCRRASESGTRRGWVVGFWGILGRGLRVGRGWKMFEEFREDPDMPGFGGSGDFDEFPFIW